MNKVTYEPVKVNYTKGAKKAKYKFGGIEIEGLDELVEAFNKLDINTIYKLAPYTVEAAEIVAEKAKSKINNIPDSKDLRTKIVVKKPGRDKKNHKRTQVFSKVTLKGGKSGGQYGVPLELGHRLVYFGYKTYKTIAPRPFLRPAAEESKEQVANILIDGMTNILNEWGE